MKLSFEDLKGLCKAHDVPHGRTKGEAAEKLIGSGRMATELQARYMVDLKVKAFAYGHDVEITAADLACTQTASKWIDKVRRECVK